MFWRLLIASCCCWTITSQLPAQEWTRFRGPNGSGQSEATTIPATWTDHDYNWKIALPGVGHSSPVVWGNHVFVTSANSQTGAQIVLCYKSSDGSELWRKEFAADKHHVHNQNSLASSTPTVDRERVYVAWASPEQYLLVALDHSGKEIWRRDLGKYISQHGFGTSPILIDDLVVITDDQDGESFLFAVDQRTGAVRWKIPHRQAPGAQNASYATPCIRPKAGGGNELVVASWGEGLSGIDPASGHANWELGLFTKRPVGSPILVGDLILGNCGEGGGDNYVAAVRPGDGAQQKPELAYKIEKSISPYVPSLVAKGNHVFLWTDKGIVSCIDAADGGKVIWKQRVGGNFFGSPVRVADRLYCISTTGDVIVLAGGDQFERLAKVSLGESSNATPAVADGVMYLRTQSHLFALGGKK